MTKKEEQELGKKLVRITKTLVSLIVYMAQSSGSPISLSDAKELLDMLEP